MNEAIKKYLCSNNADSIKVGVNLIFSTDIENLKEWKQYIYKEDDLISNIFFDKIVSEIKIYMNKKIILDENKLDV